MKPSDAKAVIAPLEAALYAHAAEATPVVRDVLAEAHIRLCFPFEDLAGGQMYWEEALAPLVHAMPDMERRVMIRVAGQDADGATWVGCAGHYMGTWEVPFLDMPPTGHLAQMRFHEFFRIEAGKVVEMQAVWDLPELMEQARVWPMAPALGRSVMVPGPATGDGLGPHGHGGAEASARIEAMLDAMIQHPAKGGPDVMQIDRFWHPRFTWYGPAGIGTMRGYAGFRRHHQIPFLAAMPDRGQRPDLVQHHFFGEGDYAAVTGWPNMAQTISGDGWLGIAAAGQSVTLRSLDFWRLEDDLIRENWVLVDLLSLYDQIGVDVLARMRQLAGVAPWT